MSLVRLHAASFSAETSDGSVRTILKPTTLELGEERIAVIGANGSGKSTLLRLLNGLLLPSGGSVTVNGLDTRSQGGAVRRQVGFVFTDPLSQLVMPTPLEDIELSLRRTVKSAAQRSRQARRILQEYGLGALAGNSVYELSGGERQLAALATVLAVNPQLLVLDEPSTLLDLNNTRLLRARLAGLSQQLIISTHDLELAQDCTRALVMEDGGVVFDGAASEAVDRYRAMYA